jgi:3-deoxy-7-phosphoheptulonate synthase
MLVVMQTHATTEQIDAVVRAIHERGLTPHVLPGATRTAIGLTGNTAAVEKSSFEVLSGVEEAIRVTKPFKLASREMHRDDTRITLPMADINASTFTVIGGPCSVENEKITFETAEFLLSHGIRLLRAGAFKPRTSPYSFQGLGLDGLQILKRVREKTGIGIVTELMDTDHASAVEEACDIIQIGTRNMQNFSLLKRVGLCRKPVLLKRGMSATLEEWLMSAEYVMAGGNYQVILCERGVRTFNDHSRNTLDLSVIPPAKVLSHLPIFVDPSHGTGKRAYVPAMSMASLAAGADGLLIEVHPDPDRAASDGPQTLNFDTTAKLMKQLRALGDVVGRTV